MSASNKKIPSLFVFTLRGKDLEVFPFFTLRHFIFLIIIAILCLFIIDRILLPEAALKGSLDVSGQWKRENGIINENNYKKIGMNPVWQSPGFSVSPEKRTSKRILVMGDSFAWGDGYANMNDLWWRQLQIELRRRGYKDVEVISAGLYGWGTRQQLELARKVVPVYKPDLVIWGYVTNDPDEGVLPVLIDTEAWEKYDENLKETYSFHRLIYKKIEPIFPNFARIVRDFRMKKLLHDNPPPESTGIPYPEWELQLLYGENFERYGNTLKEVAAFIAESQIPQFFVTLPNLPDHSWFQMRYGTVIKLFSRNNIPFYDLLPKYIEKYGDDRRPVLQWGINPANGHPGVVTTKFYAEYVADLLEKQYPRVLPEKGAFAPEIHVNDWMPWDLRIVRNDRRIEFIYPETGELMLHMPYGYPYVQFNLQFPLPLSGITLEGEGLKSANLDMTFDDGDGINVYQMGERTGHALTWELAEKHGGKAVKTIRISASFNKEPEGAVSRKLILTCFVSNKKS